MHGLVYRAVWYFLAFCVTWAPSTIWSIRHYRKGASFHLDLAAAICEPLAGFWNLLIFLSNRPSLRKQILARLMCRSVTAEDDNQDSSLKETKAEQPSVSVASKA